MHAKKIDGDKKIKPDAKKNVASRKKPVVLERYIAYPAAMKLLHDRLSATREELAAWVYFGPRLGGISAYTNGNEVHPPPRFFYSHEGINFDYISPLMFCWFNADEIANFETADRYITGAKLIERWSHRNDLEVRVYIQAKIQESRLLDHHPITGGTRATFPEMENGPPLETGLFLLSEVEEVELNDLGQSSDNKHTDEHPVGSAEWRKKIAKIAADALHDQPGGSRDKKRQIREIWASGNFTSKDTCAEQECDALGMALSTARRALIGAPKPSRC